MSSLAMSTTRFLKHATTTHVRAAHLPFQMWVVVCSQLSVSEHTYFAAVCKQFSRVAAMKASWCPRMTLPFSHSEIPRTLVLGNIVELTLSDTMVPDRISETFPNVEVLIAKRVRSLIRTPRKLKHLVCYGCELNPLLLSSLPTSVETIILVNCRLVGYDSFSYCVSHLSKLNLLAVNTCMFDRGIGSCEDNPLKDVRVVTGRCIGPFIPLFEKHSFRHVSVTLRGTFWCYTCSPVGLLAGMHDIEHLVLNQRAFDLHADDLRNASNLQALGLRDNKREAVRSFAEFPIYDADQPESLPIYGTMRDMVNLYRHCMEQGTNASKHLFNAVSAHPGAGARRYCGCGNRAVHICAACRRLMCCSAPYSSLCTWSNHYADCMDFLVWHYYDIAWPKYSALRGTDNYIQLKHSGGITTLTWPE